MRACKSMYLCTALALIGLAAVFCLPTPYPGHAEKAAEKQSDAAEMICPKCKGPMEQGVVLDYWENTFNQTKWAAGNPKRHILGWMPKTKNVVTYRCTNCGFLEAYAK